MKDEICRVFRAMMRLIPRQRRRVPDRAAIISAIGTFDDVRSRKYAIQFPVVSDNNSRDNVYSDRDSTAIDDGHRVTLPYTTDQYSQIEISSAEVIGTQWAGVAVRIRDDGQDAYVGVCRRNKRRSVWTLFRLADGRWTKLGSSYNGGPLAAGTQLRLVAVGSTIAFMENGVQRVAAGDNTSTQRNAWPADRRYDPGGSVVYRPCWVRDPLPKH